jgi:hypothetical protein
MLNSTSCRAAAAGSAGSSPTRPIGTTPAGRNTVSGILILKARSTWEASSVAFRDVYPALWQPSENTFSNAFSLELRDRIENVHLKLPAGVVASMPPARLTNEHAKRLQFLEQHDQMFQVASKAIETPADDGIESPAFRISQHRVQRRPAILRAGDAAVDVLLRRPAACASTYRRSS